MCAEVANLTGRRITNRSMWMLGIGLVFIAIGVLSKLHMNDVAASFKAAADSGMQIEEARQYFPTFMWCWAGQILGIIGLPIIIGGIVQAVGGMQQTIEESATKSKSEAES